MPPKRQKRRQEGGGDGGGGGDRGGGAGGEGAASERGGGGSALERRCRSFDLRSCRCTSSCRHHQEVPTACVCAQAINQFKEEVKEVLTTILSRLPDPNMRIEDLPPTYKLCFVNRMSEKIFTKKEVRAADGSYIKIRISNPQSSICPRLLSANVKIVVLDGDFNADNREGWTSEDFDNHIVLPRDNVGAVLTGKKELKLKNGEVYLENYTFADNSKFTRSGKFRLGVKLTDNLGERVQEGITEPFHVKDRRGEGSEKVDVPTLETEVWRLEKIAKNGAFCRALEQSGITSVKDFLRLYYKDQKALRDILSSAPPSNWTKMVNHAKKCHPGSALYSHLMEDTNIRLYFSSVGQIVGMTIDDQFKAFGDLDTHDKGRLEEWSKDAYECLTYRQPDYEMYGSQPRPIDCNSVQRSITSTTGPESTHPTDQIIQEADEQNTSKGNGFSGSYYQQRRTSRKHGSKRPRTSPSFENETDASFDIDDQLDPCPETQHTLDANRITDGSVTLQQITAANEIIGAAQLDQGDLTMDEGNYWMPFTNDDSSASSEQQVASQCEYPFSLSTPDDHHSFSDSEINELIKSLRQDLCEDLLINNMTQFSAARLNELPADVQRCMVKLLSYRRWIKLTALVKWMAIWASKGKANA
ncbi:unnamed protein product [Urochloa decumbens]|uniref:Uncharacterized protein n=1 Tax=Urochloa decumbens TaxID=240449 RepID=A0ABC8VXS3_9POAL